MMVQLEKCAWASRRMFQGDKHIRARNAGRGRTGTCRSREPSWDSLGPGRQFRQHLSVSVSTVVYETWYSVRLELFITRSIAIAYVLLRPP